jgi:hypothetical protein
MNGPEHYAKAENVLAQVEDRDVSASAVAAYTAVAQVHATLALTAATALGRFADMPANDSDDWLAVVGYAAGKQVTP